MSKEEAKQYYTLWSDAWSLFRKWGSGLENSDSFFQKCGEEAKEFVAKHAEHEGLATNIMMDILMELGRISTTLERVDE